jgi:4-diphosphocytidyl-2-C-methyl-D-erythritol kinase
VKKIKIKSYCKINLSLNVIQKLKNGYHNIMSLITFCKIYDVITINKINGNSDRINFSGKFKEGINKKSNTVTQLLHLLRRKKLLKNEKFAINIKKNIPHGSGLGGGSSNAANLLNFINSHLKLKMNKKMMEKISNEIGFDVPISLVKKNTFLTGRGQEMLRLKNKFNLNLLIVYPNLLCSTKVIYKKNKEINFLKFNYLPNLKSNKKLVYFLKEQKNDLQKIVIKTYPRIGKIISLIKSIKGCYCARITGSGSACIGIFSTMRDAIYAKKLIKLKYPKYWCEASKTI